MKLRRNDGTQRSPGTGARQVQPQTGQVQPQTDAPAARAEPRRADGYGGAPAPVDLPAVSARPLAAKPAPAAKTTPVSTLSHVQLPARFESAKLKLDLPLKAGTWKLPLGEKTAIIEVPEGTSLHVEATVDGKGAQPTLNSASMRSTQPLRVKNAEDLVDLGIPLSNLMGKVAGAVVDVQLTGLDIGPDGKLIPDLAVVVPELNPLSRLRGNTSHVQRVPVVKSLMPRLNVDARALLAGDLFADAYSGVLTKPLQPKGLDLKAVLGGVGAMAGQGHVELEMRTDVGDIALGKGAVGVKHDGSAMELEVSGDFLVAPDGALSSQLQGKVDTGLVDADFTAAMNAQATPTGLHGSVQATANVSSEPGGKIRLDSNDGAISVGHGALTAVHSGDGIQLKVGGKLLELSSAMGSALKVKLGPEVTASLDAEVGASADFGLDLTSDGVAVRAGDATAAVKTGGICLAAPNYDVELGPGSQLQMDSGQVSFDPSRGLSVTGSDGRFELSVPKGRMKVGPLNGALTGDSNQIVGTIELQPTAPGGPSVQAQADARITGRGGLGRFLAPLDVTLERKMAVTLSGDRVEVKKL